MKIKFYRKLKKDYLLTKNYNRDIRVPEDFELDIKYHTKSFEKLKEIFVEKEVKNEDDENDDIVCYVCGDGEYEDDNLIIYCSRCNMTVHQKCYGVLIIPEEDWICHLCKAFNDMNVCNNMECILCPNVGGAMKPCTLKKSSHSYKLMIKNRKSPNLKDNNNKNNHKNNNNLKNSIFFIDKNKVGKKKEINNHNNVLNSNINNNSDNVTEKNIFFSDISQTPNIVNLISSNNINANNSINNSINNNSDNNSNQQINNSIQSYRSSNLNKETESLYSNSSSIKINEDITNITNPINNKNNHLLKKQIKLKTQNEILFFYLINNFIF